MKTNFNIDDLRAISLFKMLTEEQLRALYNDSNIFYAPKHSIIYEYGDAISHVYIVVKGTVKLASKTESNKVLVKYLVYQNEIFGENVFSSNNNRLEFADPLSDALILKIGITTFKNIIGLNGEFMSSIAKIIIGRIKDLDERMESFVFLKAKERIINFVKKTANLHGITIGMNEILVNHGMSHREIAYLTDTSRQTVARILNELKEANIIHFSDRKPNKILIRQFASL
jgi:CRP-like cAMP-binding protein